MAERLATIFGTEKDRVNCPFYFKIGRCRQHNRPSISPTILVPNMYLNPFVRQRDVDPIVRQDHFDDFFEDVYQELSKHGKLESMHVCANEAEHMIGNLYAKYYDEEDAEVALKALQAQTYEGRILMPEFSPVTDFREATCRQYEEGGCKRGLEMGGRRRDRGGKRRRSPGRRTPSPHRHRSYRRSPSPRSHRSRRRSYSRDRDRRRSYSRDRDGRRSDSRDRDGRRPYSRDRDRRRSDSRESDPRRQERDNDGHRTRGRVRSPSPHRRERDASEERRARIASWNAERERREGQT